MTREPDWATADGRVKLYLGDCLEILPTLGKVDCVIADPPYGIAFAHGGGGGCLARSTAFAHEAIYGDDKPFDPSPFLEAAEVVLWGANHFSQWLPSESRWLTWDKRAGMTSNDQADCEHAWTNLGGPARMWSHKWNGMIRDGEESGVPRVHPMQKRVAIMLWCVGMTKGETVVDPYMGSGTTGVACVRLGRQFIGIEKEPRYFEIAVKRIKAELERAPLFEPKPTYITRPLFDSP